MRPMDLDEITALIATATQPINVLWQTDDSIAFVARGREGRSEFHVDPSDEVMYMIRGDMNLHYRTPEGQEKVAVIKENIVVRRFARFVPRFFAFAISLLHGVVASSP